MQIIAKVIVFFSCFIFITKASIAADENQMPHYDVDLVFNFDGFNPDPAVIAASQIKIFIGTICENAFRYSDFDRIHYPNVIFPRNKQNIFIIYRTLHVLAQSKIAHLAQNRQLSIEAFVRPGNALIIRSVVEEAIDIVLGEERFTSVELQLLANHLHAYQNELNMECDP